MACNAALAVINTIENEHLLARAEALGQRMHSQLEEALWAPEINNKVTEVRSFGLLIGIELTSDCTELVEAAKQKGLLINVTAGNTIRLLPPLILTNEEADQVVQTVVSLIEAF